jgi:hypothetical protein
VRLVWSTSVEDLDLAGIFGVFDRDLEHCPNCGDAVKISAAILEQSAIEKILTRCSCCRTSGWVTWRWASPAPR